MLEALSGSVGDMILKHYQYGTVISKRPDRNKVKLTTPQKKANTKFKKAVEYAQSELKDPVLQKVSGLCTLYLQLNPHVMKKTLTSATGRLISLFTLVLIFCFYCLPSHAQIKVWDKRYGGSEHDDLSHSLATPDGGYILGGHSDSPISGDKSQSPRGGSDFWIIKLNGKGNRVWDKRYGGKTADLLTMMVAVPDSGFLLGGWSDSPRGGDKSQNAWSRWDDYWVVKIDRNGNRLWDRRFGGNDIDHMLSMVATPDGGFILGGSSFSGVSGNKTQPSRGSDDYWLVKIDGAGNQLWDRRYGGEGSDLLTEIAPTVDGGYLLAGRSDSKEGGDKSESSRGEFDYWIVKIDAYGNKLWDKTFGGDMFDLPCKLLQTPDDGFLIGGQSDSDIGFDVSQPTRSPFFDDMWVVKIDKEGNKLWDRRFGGTHADGLRDIDVLPSGNYLLSGWSYSDISFEKTEPSWGWGDFWMVTMDQYGNYISDKRYGGTEYEAIYSVTPMPDETFLLAGTSQTDLDGDKTVPTRGAYDFWIIKFNPRPAVVFRPADFLVVCSPLCPFIDLDIRTNIFRGISAFSFRLTLPSGKAVFNKSGHTFNPKLQSPVSFTVENDSTMLITWKNGENIPLGKDVSLLHTSIKILDNSVGNFPVCISDIQAYNEKGKKVDVVAECGNGIFKNANGGRVASQSTSEEIFPAPSIFPNPGTGLYKLTLPRAGHYAISVRDTRGITLSKVEVSTKENNSEETLDLRELPSGFYLIDVSCGYRKHVVKIIKR